MSGDDIVKRLRQAHQAVPVPSLASLYSDAADEIERLHAERDAQRMRVRAEMARRGLLHSQLAVYEDQDTEFHILPRKEVDTITAAWEFLMWLDKETEVRRG